MYKTLGILFLVRVFLGCTSNETTDEEELPFSTKYGVYMLEGQRIVMGTEFYKNGSGYSEIASLTFPYNFFLAATALSEWKTKEERRKAANLTEEALGDLDLRQALINVTKIQVANFMLPPLPESSQIERLMIHSGSLQKDLGECSKLTYLRIVLAKFELVTTDWLASCSQLRTIELQEFYLADNKVHILLDSVPHLQELILTVVNDLQRIVEFPLFPFPRGRHDSIEELLVFGTIDENIANVSAGIASQMSLLPKLRSLDFSNMVKFDLCAEGFPSVTFPSLERLNLELTGTTRICFKEYRAMPELIHLNLRETMISKLEFGELFSDSKPHLQVDLNGESLQHIIVKKEDYNRLFNGTNKGNVTISGFKILSVDCDCQNAYLWKALREKVITTRGRIDCNDNSIPMSNASKQLECDRFSCSPCTCRRDWHTGELSADCRNLQLTEMPTDVLRLKDLKHLLLSNNSLSNVPIVIPASLVKIDLTNNDIGQLSSSETAALFATSDRRVQLLGNPITCSCDNKFLLDALYDHHGQVEDYEKIRCVGTTTLLHQVDTTHICKDRDLVTAGTAVLAALAVAALMTALGLALYFRRSIKIFLFARGYCLCWLREDDFDSDKVYDVFLSFCHTDVEFVTEKLLPFLDQDYKVCVHFRDWVPGILIPTQIVRSVEVSRKTIVVLSKNFLNSEWGLLEFRTAHMNGLHEERVRLIIIILDDVLETDLESELRSYLRTNTYVKWGDPWLWDKLRYALPHRTIPQTQQHKTNGFINEAHDTTDIHYND